MILSFERVTSLPDPLSPSTVYILRPNESSPYVELYYTSEDGNSIYRQPILNDIQQLIADAIAAIPSGGGGVQEVIYAATIADRNSKTYLSNALVLVGDATADPTVNSGSALYFFNFATTTWYKIAEYESLDLSFDWNTLLNKPTSSAADIDDAVAKRHEHLNTEVLNALGKDVDNNLTFNGTPVAGNILKKSDW